MYHKEFWALHGINLEVFSGETFGIVGRNGSGKSTLLQIITGIMQPSSGTVTVNGRVSALLELGAGFNREFTGKENVFMNGAILGISRSEMEKRFKEIEAFAGIGSFINQPVKTYSSGMYVRLAFATAVHVDPDILIIDEALAVGDEIFRRRCYQKIDEFQKKGKTILFVSHSLQVIKTLCSRALLLEKGKILEIGDPGTIVHTYNDLVSNKESANLSKKTGPESDKINKLADDVGDVPGGGSIPTEYRYGSGEGKVIGFRLLDREGNEISVAEFGEVCRVRVTAKFDKNVKNPQVGMRISTLRGIAVSGTITEYEGISIGSVKAGDTITVEFQFEMLLKPDDYTLSIGLSEVMPDGEYEALDRRMDAMIFKVVGKKKFMGLVDIGFNISVLKNESANSLS